VGLKFRAAFSSDPNSQVVRTKALEGHLSGVSIGYLPMPGGVAFKQGDDGEPVRVLSEVRLFEISLTPVPANPEAQLTSVKSAVVTTTTSLDLAQFSDAMRKALAIDFEPARKAAVDILVGTYHPTQQAQAAEPADEPDTTAEDAAATTPPGPAGTASVSSDVATKSLGASFERLTPREYADQIARSAGPADGSPASLDRLEAEIRQSLQALGGAT
jgi:hypothetical protein